MRGRGKPKSVAVFGFRGLRGDRPLRVSSEDTGLSAPSLVITADRVDQGPVPLWSPTPLTSWLLPENKDCLWRKEVEGAHCAPTCPKTVGLPGSPLICFLPLAEAPVHLLPKLRALLPFLCSYRA